MNRNSILVICSSLIGIIFISAGCSDQNNAESELNNQSKVDIVTIGLSKEQNKSFAEKYAEATKSADAYLRGKELNKRGLFEEAIENFNQSISFAQSRVERAMAYNGLVTSYAGLKQIDKQIEYMEKEANATLNKDHQADLLRQIANIKASSSD